jgi:hypothetical protein
MPAEPQIDVVAQVARNKRDSSRRRLITTNASVGEIWFDVRFDRDGVSFWHRQLRVEYKNNLGRSIHLCFQIGSQLGIQLDALAN